MPARTPEPSDGLGSIYPDDITAHPLATRLCELLHLVPGRRVASCCGGEPRRYFYDQCVRVLSVSLASTAVVIDSDRLAACEAGEVEAFKGCDWVTPSQPAAPAQCQGLLEGKLAEGAPCRSAFECSGTGHCEGLGPTRTGVCKPPRQLGAVCGVPTDVLATYTLQTGGERSHPLCAAFCSLVSHRCELVPEAGSACMADVNCALDQSCIAGNCRKSEGNVPVTASAPRGPECAIAWPFSPLPVGSTPRQAPMRLPSRPAPKLQR